MPLTPQDQIVAFFTGTFDTTGPPLVNAPRVAIADYPGHLSGATNLGEALALLDVLITGGSNIYLGFSSDGISWHAVETTGDIYVRFATGTSRPDVSDPSWTVGIQYGGLQGAYYIRQYQNATSTPAVPTGGSFDVATRTLTPSTGWSIAVTAPGAGENTYFVEWLFDPSTHTGTDSSDMVRRDRVGWHWPARYPRCHSGRIVRRDPTGRRHRVRRYDSGPEDSERRRHDSEARQPSLHGRPDGSHTGPW